MCTYLDQVGSTYYFRRPVPRDLIGYFTNRRGNPQTDWKVSLRTKDRETAKRLLPAHVTRTNDLIDEAREVLAAAPLEAGQEAAETSQEREERAAREALEEASRERREARSEYRILWHQWERTSTAQLSPERAAALDRLREKDATIAELREAIAAIKTDMAALGIQTIRGGVAMPQGRLSLPVLFEQYAATGAANVKTISKWRGRVMSLVEHLGHSDADRITRADLNGWTAALVAKGLSKKTIVDGYLPAVRAAFSIAHDDGAIPANPASGLKVRAPKTVKLRERDLTDNEARTILRGTLGPHSDKLAPDHALARRWVPWLCAYTGARIAEITQLRAMDIREEGGAWVLHITPEAGSVKTNEARLVPIHSHLIEQGLLNLAKRGDDTPLFYRRGAGNAANPGHKVRAADIAKWVRSLGVTDPGVQPNHGWRHRFKTTTRLVGVPENVADAIQGHAPRHEGGKYGSVPLATLQEAIERLPRFEVAPAPLEDGE